MNQQSRPKKTYDAARTKEIILDAAEEIFAELGFSAARIDAIAQASGYNKSLIYQYFQDKLGLYTEVVKRADQLGDRMLAEMTGELMIDEALTEDANKFRLFLETIIRGSYEFLLGHPRFLKIYAWEAAESWKTWNQIAYRPDDITVFYELAKKAKSNGLLRADLDPYFFPILLMYNVLFSIQSFSRFNGAPDVAVQAADSAQWVVHAREQVVKFIVSGVMEPSLL